jgi:hypothetical protein
MNMIRSCPHCQNNLKLGEAQQAKLQQALDALEPGKKLTIKCPACQKPISLGRDGAKGANGPAAVTPPGPPDLSWMKEGRLQDDEKIQDIPMAMVLYPGGKQRDIVRDALESVGYQVMIVDNGAMAMERMLFVNFACVVMHANFEGQSLADSAFHAYMRDLSMSRRRYLFYILIGPDFNTLYNLQALAHSANLTVNENDLLHLEMALRKAVPIYEELFGTYMEELTSAGKN